jgi:DNA uptake protein ComE-like DNA-binding protein
MRKLPLLALAAIVALPALATSAQQSKTDSESQLPPGDGRELVVNSCGSCHSLKTVVTARKTSAAWEKSVSDMIQRGAPVFPEEIKPLTSYLSQAFSTDVLVPVNVNTATRSDFEKVPGLKPEMISRLLVARTNSGPIKTSENLRQAFGIDKPEFEKIAYLFKYSD